MGNLTSQPQLDEVEQLRKQANDLKQQRNAAFEKSRTCYDKKDHDGAKSWSLKGKDMDKRAKELDAKAAELVFAKRNANRTDDSIDLHGLKVAEALQKVQQVLGEYKAQGKKSAVFIVGRGLHSADGQAKLKPAVTSLINKHNLRCTVGKPNDGCLFVEFVPAHERGWFGGLLGMLCTIM